MKIIESKYERQEQKGSFTEEQLLTSLSKYSREDAEENYEFDKI